MNTTAANNKIIHDDSISPSKFSWGGDPSKLILDLWEIRELLLNFKSPLVVVKIDDGIAFINAVDSIAPAAGRGNVIAWLPPISSNLFGDPAFCSTYGLKAPYYAGAMANAISTEQMVIALNRSGLMASFGSGGLSLDRLASAVSKIQSELGDSPFMINLLHNPFDPDMEQAAVDLFLEKKVNVIEAAAFIRLTPAVIQYRAAGLSRNKSGKILIQNRIIAKISRKEVASQFIQPAPQKILKDLVASGKITDQQALLAAQVPVADDVTVEADSGGHTDNQPLVSLLPSIIALRDQLQDQYKYPQPVRIGAAGGISTPGSLLGAFMMGAAYVVTGSINQSCLESGASEHTRILLSKAEMADVSMAPSADMFEMGSRVQVLRKGSLYPMRAQKLYDLYTNFDSIDKIPSQTRTELEEKIFQRNMEDIWQDTVTYFQKRNLDQIVRAEKNPKVKMALIFRWYLGMASRWSRDGVEDRKMDYQIWCGPSMGAFNQWVKGTYLEDHTNRRVDDIAWQLLTGCMYHSRIQGLKLHGLSFPPKLGAFYPQQQEV